MDELQGALADLTVVTAETEAAGDHNKVWYLRQSTLFAHAPQETVEGVQGIFRMERFPRKTLLFDLGDTERTIFVIKTGKVRLARLTPQGKEVTITVLGPGDMFGEEMLFGTQQRTTFAVVAEDALVCMSKADDLFAVMAADPALAVNVAKTLSSRLDQAADSIENLSYAKLSDRIMQVLRRLAEVHGRKTTIGIEIELRLTHAELASMVGSTRESVSLELQNLVKAGKLEIHGKKIILK